MVTGEVPAEILKKVRKTTFFSLVGVGERRWEDFQLCAFSVLRWWRIRSTTPTEQAAVAEVRY